MVQQQVAEPFERVDATKGKELFDSEGTIWIDVREPNEWNQGRIPGAKLVPLNTLLMSPRQHLNGDNVVFYCAQGIRSAVAFEVAAAVASRGFTIWKAGSSTGRRRGSRSPCSVRIRPYTTQG